MSKLGFPCIGLEIGLGHILCVISFLDIDIMAGLSIGIWKWIKGIYEIMHMFKDVETRFSMYWIGNWIGSYPMCYIISRY